ncbi:MAG: NfeD family protein [Spirochaetota bacterium]
MSQRITTSAVCFILFLSVQAHAAESFYTRITLKGTVNPITAEYILESINNAEQDGASFILLTVDTPGGLMVSLRKIVQAVLTAKIPVVVYTYPKGAQAASAGGFIMLAGHVNAMAPGTEIGAMHPVAPGLTFYEEEESPDRGGPTEKQVMGMKVLNDTLAFGRSIAQERGRSEEWVDNAIREAGSSTYREAHEAGVVDIIAGDINDLMSKLDARRITVDGREYIFDTASVEERDAVMSGSQKFLNFFADPQVLMLLLIIAIGGVVIEFNNPGLILPGTVGAVAFILFLMTINVIPINIIGVVLIITGFAFFVMDLYITSYGLLTLAGVAAYIGGSLMLFDNPIQGFSVSPVTIFVTSALMLLLVFVILRAVIDTHRQNTVTGESALVGLDGNVTKAIAPGSDGKVFVHGELWNAESDEVIEQGSRVTVTAVNGMKLTVTKKIINQV